MRDGIRPTSVGLAVIGMGWLLLGFGCGPGGSAPAPVPGTPSSVREEGPGAGGAPLAGESFRLTTGSETLRLTRLAPRHWELVDRGESYRAEVDSRARLTVRRGDVVLAETQLSGEKLQLAGAGGEWLLKIRADKTKIGKGGGETPLELKYKPGKVKVVLSGQELGKVQFYPETGKLKVKDHDGGEVAVLKGLGESRAAPGVLLAEKAGWLDPGQRNLLLVTLLALGK